MDVTIGSSHGSSRAMLQHRARHHFVAETREFLTSSDLMHLRRASRLSERGERVSFNSFTAPAAAGPPGVPPPVRFVQALFAEFIGSLAIGVVASLSATEPESYIAVGCIVAAVTYALAHISDAHFNPMISVGAVLTGDCHVLRGMLYVLMQLTGTTCGCLMATSFTASGAALHPSSSTSLRFGRLSTFIAEASFAAIVTFVTLVAIQKHKASRAAATGARGQSLTAPEGDSNLDSQILLPSAVKCALYGSDTVPATATANYGFAIGAITVAAVMALRSVGSIVNIGVTLGMMFASLSGGEGSLGQLWLFAVADLTGCIIAVLLIRVLRKWDGSLLVCAVECIGTFAITLTAALASVDMSLGSAGGPALRGVNAGIALGSVVVAMVAIGEHVSGGEFNPAVTLAMAIRYQVKPAVYPRVLAVIASQFVGAIAAGLLAASVSEHVAFPAPPGPREQSSAVFFELLWTAILVMVVLNVSTPTDADMDDDDNRSVALPHISISIGFTVLAGCYAAGRAASGGVFNPALGTGLAIATAMQTATQHMAKVVWIYWVAPAAGAVLSALTFSLLHYHKDYRTVALS